MSAMTSHLRRLSTVAAVVVLSVPVALCGAEPGSPVAEPPAGDTGSLPTEDVLHRIEAVVELVRATDELWPSWDMSQTPLALTCPDGYSYLVNHPNPPSGFVPLDVPSGFSWTVHRSSTDTLEAGWPSVVAGVATAYCRAEDLAQETLPSLIRSAFQVQAAELCAEAVRPIDLMSGYPIDTENLVLADLECHLLRRAALASDDSLAQCVREFVSVRRYRRLKMGGRYSEFERRLEFSEGIPAYLAERCREEARLEANGELAARLDGLMGRPLDLDRCRADTLGLEWYRSERFRWTGALLCRVMDRFYPDWKTEAAGDCAGPFGVMQKHLGGRTPTARDLLIEFGFDERIVTKAAEIEGSKGEAERLFDEITRGGRPVIAVNTHLLASGEISFDPTHIEKADAHKEVHTRLLKVEYSGGTHFYAMGIPVAVVLGDDEFDLRSLIVVAPDEYSLTLDGVPFDEDDGVYQFERSLVLEADGLSVEAMAGTVLAGTHGITLILHR